jgi:site-specific DNA-methyltransferase (adenine-specific)
MIEPTWQSGDATLYLGDCLDILPTLAAGSADLALTDPPYGETDFHFDSKQPEVGWARALLRVVQDNGYLATFGSIQLLGDLCAIWHKRFGVALIKPNGTPRSYNAKKPPSQYEPACVYAHPNHRISDLTWNKLRVEGVPWRKIRKNNHLRRNGDDSLDRNATSSFSAEGFVQSSNTRVCTDVVFGNTKPYMPHNERTAHPTQKPIEPMLMLISWLTNQGDTIIDHFMGSGTTGVACVQTGRKFIGVEIDEGYFNIAVKRIEQAQAQTRLF